MKTTYSPKTPFSFLFLLLSVATLTQTATAEPGFFKKLDGGLKETTATLAPGSFWKKPFLQIQNCSRSRILKSAGIKRLRNIQAKTFISNTALKPTPNRESTLEQSTPATLTALQMFQRTFACGLKPIIQ